MARGKPHYPEGLETTFGQRLALKSSAERSEIVEDVLQENFSFLRIRS